MSVFGNLITVEIAMIFGLGFLTAALCAVPFVGAVHQRAIRLTRKKLDGSVPVSVKEMMAEKDALRGKFAAATVALERGIETLKQKTHAHAAELGRKAEVINRLKAELDEKSATIAGLEARERTLTAREHELWNELVAARNEITANISWMQETERENTQLRGEIASLIAAVEQRGQLINTQYNEIAALGGPQAILPRPALPERRTFGLRPLPAPGDVAAARAAQPSADNVKAFDPRTTSDWLEFGKAKLRSSNGGGGSGSSPERVSPEQSAFGVRPL